MKLRELMGVTVDNIRITRDHEELYRGYSTNVPEELLDCTVDWVTGEIEFTGNTVVSYIKVRVK